MPRKTTSPEDAETPESIEAKLDRVLEYLHRMERRDRTRMIGSTIHSMIWFVSIIFVFWSSYYFLKNAPELMGTMTKQMMEQSMGIGGSATTDASTTDKYMKMLDDFMKGQK